MVSMPEYHKSSIFLFRRISAQRKQQRVLLHLHCDKPLTNDEDWSIEVEVQLILVSDTGRTLTDIYVTHIFERTEEIHWTKDLTWEDMTRDFVVNDSVRIEARVKIVEAMDDRTYEVIASDATTFEQ